MVKKYVSGNFIEQQSLLKALGIERSKSPVISVIGAGGKTTLIRKLAEEYRARQIPVIVTTTTHMMTENSPWFLLEASLEKVKTILEQEGMVWLGLPDRNSKIKAPPREFLGQVLKLEYPILIEADGAKKLPLKIPAEHEPVIIEETTDVISVYGLDAVGRRFEDICFRSDMALRLINKKTTDTVEEKDIACLALGQQGGKKGVTESMNYHVILNKADSKEREKTALEICKIAEQKGFMDFVITAENRKTENKKTENPNS